MLAHKKGKDREEGAQPRLSSISFARVLLYGCRPKSLTVNSNVRAPLFVALLLIQFARTVRSKCIAPSFSAKAVVHMEAPASQAFRQIAYWALVLVHYFMMMMISWRRRKNSSSQWGIQANSKLGRSAQPATAGEEECGKKSFKRGREMSSGCCSKRSAPKIPLEGKAGR